MNKPKYYPCEICGKEVFKQYSRGELKVMEERKIIGCIQWGPHDCSLSHGSTSGDKDGS